MVLSLTIGETISWMGKSTEEKLYRKNAMSKNKMLMILMLSSSSSCGGRIRRKASTMRGWSGVRAWQRGLNDLRGRRSRGAKDWRPQEKGKCEGAKEWGWGGRCLQGWVRSEGFRRRWFIRQEDQDVRESGMGWLMGETMENGGLRAQWPLWAAYTCRPLLCQHKLKRTQHKTQA